MPKVSQSDGSPDLAPAIEPAPALLRCAVREGVRVHAATRAALEAVVAHGLRRRERLLHVALLQVPRLVDALRPHARVAVGLQLQPHRQRVGLVRALPAQPVDLRLGAQLLLHVVAELVGDHVRPREVAGRAELGLHVAIEGEVHVGPLVGRAVERPHLAAGRAAAGPHALAEEHELGALVAIAGAREDVLPGVLRAGEDVGAEVPEVALRVLRRVDRRGLRRLGAAVERGVDREAPARAASAAEQLDGQEDDDPGHAEPAAHLAAAAARQAHAPAAAAAHARR